MQYTRLLVGLMAVFPPVVGAQLAGQFYLEKQSFAQGEPVFLYFRIPKDSPLSSSLQSGYGDQPMCSGISIKVSTDPATQTASCSIFSESLCVMNGQPADRRSGPQEYTITKRFLLNFQHRIDAPGSYWVLADRQERLGDALVPSHAKLRFQIDGKIAPYSAEKLQKWVDQLKSADVESRLEAARVLASVAPLQLESILLDFAHNQEFSRYAPLGLHRLHTQRSLIALANMVRDSPIGSFESLEAARYLATDGGKYGFPVLREAEDRRPNIGYLSFAAEAAGDAIIPELRSMILDLNRHREVVEALGWSASHQAVPILIAQLRDFDPDTRNRADWALRMLTHRSPSADTTDQRNLYLQWSEWWRREGEHAAIFKPNDCGSERPIIINSIQGN